MAIFRSKFIDLYVVGVRHQTVEFDNNKHRLKYSWCLSNSRLTIRIERRQINNTSSLYFDVRRFSIGPNSACPFQWTVFKSFPLNKIGVGIRRLPEYTKACKKSGVRAFN